MKYLILLSMALLAGCGQRALTQEQIASVADACTKAGLIVVTRTDIAGKVASVECFRYKSATQ